MGRVRLIHLGKSLASVKKGSFFYKTFLDRGDLNEASTKVYDCMSFGKFEALNLNLVKTNIPLLPNLLETFS